MPPTVPVIARSSGITGLLGVPVPLLVAVEEAGDGTKRRKITNLREEAAAVVFRCLLPQLTAFPRCSSSDSSATAILAVRLIIFAT